MSDYTPCDQCRHPGPQPDDPHIPGFTVPAMPNATFHYGWCPTVPTIDRETQERLIEMDRVRRRGAAEARNFVIG